MDESDAQFYNYLDLVSSNLSCLLKLEGTKFICFLKFKELNSLI